jgi:hypothetical protein
MACKFLVWLGHIFHNLKVKVAPVVVSILESVKGLEDTGLLPALASILDKSTHGVSSTINATLQKGITLGIASFLGIEGLPDSPTEADLLTFNDKVMAAVAEAKLKFPTKGEFWSKFGAHLYQIISDTIGPDNVHDGQGTYAKIIKAVEDAYQSYQDHLAAEKEQQDASAG